MIEGRVREAFFFFLSLLFYFFPFSTLSDCVFVGLAVGPFVAGIKACREPQDLIGNLGEKTTKEKHTRTHTHTHTHTHTRWLQQCFIDVFEHGTLISMPSKHTLKWFFNKCYV